MKRSSSRAAVCAARTTVSRRPLAVSTMTADLLALAEWLAEAGVTHVAMESTVSFGSRCGSLLEDRYTIVLVNPRHVKQVPGRKTDVAVADWLPPLQYGRLERQLHSAGAHRDLRYLTRHRTSLLHERTRTVNRIHKVLEDANIKLSAVASDIMGVSGQAMLRALVAGQTVPGALGRFGPVSVAPETGRAPTSAAGRVRAHHRFLLQTLLEQVGFSTGRSRNWTRALTSSCALSPPPGVDPDDPGPETPAGESVLAEIGPYTTMFPSAAYLCSWAAIVRATTKPAGSSGREKRAGATAGCVAP